MDIHNEKKRRGRPATGRVYDGALFIRCPKDKKDGIKWIAGKFLSGCEIGDIREWRESNQKLLADVERLEKEKAELLARPKEEFNLDYKELYLALLAERGVAKKSEFDQT